MEFRGNEKIVTNARVFTPQFRFAYAPVWKTLQTFQNLKLRKMSKTRHQ